MKNSFYVNYLNFRIARFSETRSEILMLECGILDATFEHIFLVK